MTVIRATLVAVLALVPAPLLAQVAVEKPIAFGVANVMAPAVTGGVDVVTAKRLTAGASGTLVAAFFRREPWAMYGVSAHAGFRGADYSKTQLFIVGELGVFHETDCCGASVDAGLTLGGTRWRNQRSALRIEGRLLLPLTGDGGLLVFQLGLTFR